MSLRVSHMTRMSKAELIPWMLLLVRLKPTYGYELREDLRARGFYAEPSAVYRTLRELEAHGTIVSRWVPATDGPRRRVYELTPDGVTLLDETAATWGATRNAQAAFLRAHRGRAVGS